MAAARLVRLKVGEWGTSAWADCPEDLVAIMRHLGIRCDGPRPSGFWHGEWYIHCYAAENGGRDLATLLRPYLEED